MTTTSTTPAPSPRTVTAALPTELHLIDVGAIAPGVVRLTVGPGQARAAVGAMIRAGFDAARQHDSEQILTVTAREPEGDELHSLEQIIAAMRDDETLNANPSIAMLGGNLRGTFDAANPGIVMTINEGASEYDLELEGPADVLICRWAEGDDDTETELARGTASSVEDVLALYGTVVGRG